VAGRSDIVFRAGQEAGCTRAVHYAHKDGKARGTLGFEVLLFVSDLHLSDSRKRSVFDFPAFERVVQETVRDAVELRADRLTLVLLGDIFELLKSAEWLHEKRRPWQAPDTIADIVTTIMNRVIDENPEFFELLGKLCSEHPFFSVVFVPGNHDRVLNTPAGSAARRGLHKLLPLGRPDGRPFREDYQDREHRVLAQHGHQWDRINAYGADTAAVGDLIVVDVVTQLPHAVASELRLPSADDPRLDFLHAIDSVLPQTPHAMARWALLGLEGLVAQGFDGGAIDRALDVISRSVLVSLSDEAFRGETGGQHWLRLIERMRSIIMRRYGGTRVALWIDEDDDTRIEYAKCAADNLEQALARGLDYRYIVFGHTHVPDHRVLAAGGSARLYLNVGTWRRSHQMAVQDAPRERAEFMSCTANTYAIIYSPDEVKRGRPEYVFRPVHYA
jgi:UDP-2,3-diacylglucosamine pyrophosphatase LpxH